MAWTQGFCTSTSNYRNSRHLNTEQNNTASSTGWGKKALIYWWMRQRDAFSTLPLNRPATEEGSVGKGAWCGRCWAMDTGPQKESDTPQEARRTQRKERQEERKYFKARPRDMEEVTAILHKERRELTCTKVIKLLSKIWGGYVPQQPKGKH